MGRGEFQNTYRMLVPWKVIKQYGHDGWDNRGCQADQYGKTKEKLRFNSINRDWKARAAVNAHQQIMENLSSSSNFNLLGETLNLVDIGGAFNKYT